MRGNWSPPQDEAHATTTRLATKTARFSEFPNFKAIGCRAEAIQTSCSVLLGFWRQRETQDAGQDH